MALSISLFLSLPISLSFPPSLSLYLSLPISLSFFLSLPLSLFPSLYLTLSLSLLSQAWKIGTTATVLESRTTADGVAGQELKSFPDEKNGYHDRIQSTSKNGPFESHPAPVNV
jgi:hypothetical protein